MKQIQKSEHSSKYIEQNTILGISDNNIIISDQLFSDNDELDEYNGNFEQDNKQLYKIIEKYSDKE